MHRIGHVYVIQNAGYSIRPSGAVVWYPQFVDSKTNAEALLLLTVGCMWAIRFLKYFVGT